MWKIFFDKILGIFFCVYAALALFVSYISNVICLIFVHCWYLLSAVVLYLQLMNFKINNSFSWNVFLHRFLSCHAFWLRQLSKSGKHDFSSSSSSYCLAATLRWFALPSNLKGLVQLQFSFPMPYVHESKIGLSRFWFWDAISLYVWVSVLERRYRLARIKDSLYFQAFSASLTHLVIWIF